MGGLGQLKPVPLARLLDFLNKRSEVIEFFFVFRRHADIDGNAFGQIGAMSVGGMHDATVGEFLVGNRREIQPRGFFQTLKEIQVEFLAEINLADGLLLAQDFRAFCWLRQTRESKKRRYIF